MTPSKRLPSSGLYTYAALMALAAAIVSWWMSSLQILP